MSDVNDINLALCIPYRIGESNEMSDFMCSTINKDISFFTPCNLQILSIA